MESSNTQSMDIDERFKALLANSLANPLLTKNQQDVFIKWANVFYALKDENHKNVMYCKLSEYFASVEFLYRFRQLEKLLPVAETLLAAGMLDEAFELADVLLTEQQKANAQESLTKGRAQTEKATEAHKDRETWHAIIKKLEPYMIEVENKWHPLVAPELRSQRSASHSKKLSINSVFTANKNEIIQTLCEFNISMDPASAFAKAFEMYTDAYLTVSHTTRNGYQRESRLPRSEASKERSRQAALKRRQTKK